MPPLAGLAGVARDEAAAAPAAGTSPPALVLEVVTNTDAEAPLEQAARPRPEPAPKGGAAARTAAVLRLAAAERRQTRPAEPERPKPKARLTRSLQSRSTLRKYRLWLLRPGLLEP